MTIDDDTNNSDIIVSTKENPKKEIYLQGNKSFVPDNFSNQIIEHGSFISLDTSNFNSTSNTEYEENHINSRINELKFSSTAKSIIGNVIITCPTLKASRLPFSTDIEKSLSKFFTHFHPKRVIFLNKIKLIFVDFL